MRARGNMSGVLALGAAGYGVALTFLLYGAPDLAVTQFAVETLTAVIFVFVLWQLPRSEDKSSPRVKRRDALGEITVLVTAALGVSALLRIAAKQKQERTP